MHFGFCKEVSPFLDRDCIISIRVDTSDDRIDDLVVNTQKVTKFLASDRFSPLSIDCVKGLLSRVSRNVFKLFFEGVHLGL